MSPAIVIGPVGLERHVLVSHLATDTPSGHAVARSFFGETEQLGGSGYFATAALRAEGVEVALITNTGETDTIRGHLERELPLSSVHDSRTGPASAYLSLWDTKGGKQLFVRSASDPVDVAIASVTAQPEAVVIAASLRDVTSYEAMMSLEGAGSRLFVAPNQTLLDEVDTFARLARSAVAITLSESEAKEAAAAETMEGVFAWYRTLMPTATLIVTHGGESLSVVEAGAVREISLNPDPQRTRVLGGGDTFLALVAVHWAPDQADFGLTLAAQAAARHLPSGPAFASGQA